MTAHTETFKGTRNQGGSQTVAVCGRGSNGHQGVHIGGFVFEGGPKALVKRPAEPKLYGCSQEQ